MGCLFGLQPFLKHCPWCLAGQSRDLSSHLLALAELWKGWEILAKDCLTRLSLYLGVAIRPHGFQQSDGFKALLR